MNSNDFQTRNPRSGRPLAHGRGILLIEALVALLIAAMLMVGIMEMFQMSGNLTQYVDHRPLFGRKQIKGLPIKFIGRVDDGVIDSEARVADGGWESLRFRMHRVPVILSPLRRSGPIRSGAGRTSPG